MKKLKNKIAINWQIFILILLSVISVLICLGFLLNLPSSWNSNPKLIFNSPDETANYYFTNHFANQTSLQFNDDANKIAGELVSPRSMRVINGKTVPAGFLGIPIIFGTLAKLLGTCSIPFFTPLIGIIGLFFFYLVIKEIFNKNIAFISTLFAFILPSFWYYLIKSMMPNVAFVSFFIIALYFFIKLLKQKKVWFYLLFGFFIALALMIRTSEIVWLAPLFLILTIVNYKKINFKFLILSLIIFIITFSSIFFFNQQNYGNPFSLGYSFESDLQAKNIFEQSLSITEQIFLPFGFHPRLALKNIYNYTFGIFPLWSFLILISLLIIIGSSVTRFDSARRVGHRSLTSKNKNSFRLAYLTFFLATSVYLIIYYGSWQFNDNPDPNAVTIGTSYIRYWLPLYLFSLPFLAYVINILFKKYKVGYPLIIIYLLTVLAISSFQIVILDKEEGIFQVNKNISEYQNIAEKVFNQTETNAIIIAENLDKVFFPVRSIIFKLNNQRDYVKIKELIKAGYPVYYFYFSRSEEDLQFFSQKYFEPFDLKVEPSILDFDKQSLYPVSLLNKER